MADKYKKPPKADEFFEEWCKKRGYSSIDQANDIEVCLAEFARLHVEAALEAASEKALVYFEKRTRTYCAVNKRFVVNGGDVYTVDKISILKSYPVEDIKSC